MLERNIFQHSNASNLSNSTAGAVSIAECAALSSHIYGNGSLPPAGWQLLHFCSGADGYAGACYARNLLTTNTQLVFVHRGTVLNFPDGVGNVIGDIELAFGYIPSQCTSVLSLIQAVSEKLQKIYKMDDENATDVHELIQYINTSTTGHSLGAVLSDVTALYVPGSTSITFENPGSKPVIQAILSNMSVPADAQIETLLQLKNNCHAYQAGVNIINTCNEQVGRAFRIDDLDYLYKLNMLGVKGFPPAPSYFSEFTYLTDYTMDQHSIMKIAQYTNTDKSVIEINNPIGFQAGYIEYVNPMNKKYWDGYLRAIWESDSLLAAAIRLKYDNEDEFRIHGYQQITIVYNEISKNKELIHQPVDKLFYPQLSLFNANQKTDDDIINDFILIDKQSCQEDSRQICVIM